MAYDLPFLSSAQRRASRLRPRTEEELDPWGATTVPRAPQIREPDIPTIPTQPEAATADLTTMAGRIEASRIYGAPEPGSMAAELGLQQADPFAPTRQMPPSAPSYTATPNIPLTPSGIGITTTDPVDTSPQPYVADPREAELPPDANVTSILDQKAYMQDVARGNITGHALSGYNTMPPVVREMALDRYEADWKKTNIALFSNWETDKELSGFQKSGRLYGSTQAGHGKTLTTGSQHGVRGEASSSPTPWVRLT
jgi:hypothetical protein